MTIMPTTCLLAETRMAEISLQYREQVASGAASQWWYLLIPVVAIAIACLIRSEVVSALIRSHEKSSPYSSPSSWLKEPRRRSNRRHLAM